MCCGKVSFVLAFICVAIFYLERSLGLSLMPVD